MFFQCLTANKNLDRRHLCNKRVFDLAFMPNQTLHMRLEFIPIQMLSHMLISLWTKLVPRKDAVRIATAIVRTALQKDERMDPVGDSIEDFKRAVKRKRKYKESLRIGPTRRYDLNGMPAIIFLPSLTDTAINLSKKFGIGVISIRNSGGVDFLSTWLLDFPLHDCIGMFIWNGGSYTTVPFGSREPFFGTNPLAYAIPTANEPLLLDMSTSEITFMDLMNAIEQGYPIPEGAGLGENGRSTIDPRRVYDIRADSDVRLLPIGGGYKGSAIVLLIEILTGALIDSKMAREASSSIQKPEEFGGILIAIDVGSFTSPILFKRKVTCMLNQIRSSKRVPGISSIKVPGDGSYSRERERMQSGKVAVNADVLRELRTLNR